MLDFQKQLIIFQPVVRYGIFSCFFMGLIIGAFRGIYMSDLCKYWKAILFQVVSFHFHSFQGGWIPCHPYACTLFASNKIFLSEKMIGVKQQYVRKCLEKDISSFFKSKIYEEEILSYDHIPHVRYANNFQGICQLHVVDQLEF